MTRADQSIADAVFGYWNRQVIEWNHPHGVPAKTVKRGKADANSSCISHKGLDTRLNRSESLNADAQSPSPHTMETE